MDFDGLGVHVDHPGEHLERPIGLLVDDVVEARKIVGRQAPTAHAPRRTLHASSQAPFHIARDTNGYKRGQERGFSHDLGAGAAGS